MATIDDLQAAFNGESNARVKYLAFAKKADEEVNVFMDKLQDRFDEMGKNRLVLLKDVVLGGHAVDVTDKLISYADGNSESKGGRTGK